MNAKFIARPIDDHLVDKMMTRIVERVRLEGPLSKPGGVDDKARAFAAKRHSELLVLIEADRVEILRRMRR